MKKIITLSFAAVTLQALGQDWSTTLNNGIPNNLFGTTSNVPINIYTNNTFRAQFTTGSALTSLVGNLGDGLRIVDPTGLAGNLDLFTSGPGSMGGNETHAKFGTNGQVSGQNNRFEFIGTTGIGNYYDVTQGSAWHNFSRLGVEQGRLGNNNFWRFGLGTGANAARRVEIVDGVQQVRISNTNSSYAELFTRANGRFLIMPTGANTGFTSAGDVSYDPTERIDVNGTGRFRNVPSATPDALFVGVRNAGNTSDLTMRRLDFPGTPNQVLLGNGTWGTLPPSTPPLADNGVSRNVLFNGPYQLGDLYLNPLNLFNTVTPLSSNRQVRLGNNSLIFSGTGSVGIGLSWPNLPTEVFDVNGNARFRNVPEQGGGSLILGLQNGSSADDIELSRLEFPNNNTVALLGDGTWGTLGSVTGANNGASVSTVTPSLIVFGQDYLQAGDPARLLNNRQIPMQGFNILYTDKGRIGLGSLFSIPGNNPLAKLDVRPTAADELGIYVQNQNNMSSFPDYRMNRLHNDATGTQINTSLYVETKGNPVKMAVGINTKALAVSVPINLGIDGWAIGATQTNVGGRFNATGSAPQNTGVQGYGNSANVNKGAEFRGGNPFDVTSILNVGSYSQAIGGYHSIAVYGEAFGGTAINHAGYFNGNVEVINGTYISDQQFKTNVSTIQSGLKGVMQLKPVQYLFDIAGFPQFNFGSEQQFGFVAQDVMQVFPNLVYESEHPAEYDSLGNVVTPALPYKALNYNGLIPVNTQAIIELNRKVDAISLSDESIKTNVQDLSGSLNKVLDMRGVSYDWNHVVHPELNLDSANQVGFIAQEIQLIDPRLTFVADDSLLHVKYEKVVPILAEAIEELNGQVESKDSIIGAQQSQIEDLNNRLSQLENCLSGILPYLCQLSQSAIQANTPAAQEVVRSNLNVTLSSRNTIILDQNVPNPFAEQTVINFSIPETVKKAQIHFYDEQGKLIQSVDVVDRGLGSITVFGSDLSSGIYTYTLVADGQAVATKKMMKQ